MSQLSQANQKQSFEYAYILDSDETERARGITIQNSRKTIVTDKRVIQLIDTPGHTNFISEMVSAVDEADIAVYVVSAKATDYLKIVADQHL